MRRLSVRIAVRSLVGSTYVGGSLVVVDATAAKHEGAILLLEKFA
jgi:hypothetical protein